MMNALGKQSKPMPAALWRPQRGVVLIVALIVLLVMTLVGISAMSGATLQERMAGNARQKSIARLNAEAGLRSAEAFMDGLNIRLKSSFSTQFTSANNGLYSPKAIESILAEKNFPSGFSIRDIDSWIDVPTASVRVLGTGLSANSFASNREPRYVIEYIGKFDEIGGGRVSVLDSNEKDSVDSGPFVFRITAIGWGRDVNAVALLQTNYITAQ